MISKNEPSIPTTNLLFWFDPGITASFSGTGATAIYDLGPNRIYASYTGTHSFSYNGYSFGVSGANNYISATVPSSANTVDFTATMWLKCNYTELPVSTSFASVPFQMVYGNYHLTFDYNDQDLGTPGKTLWMYWNGSGQNRITVSSSRSPLRSEFFDGLWRCVTFRRNASTDPYTDIFVNGDKLATGLSSAGSQTDTFFQGGNATVIYGNAFNFKGELGPCYAYSKALTDDEIKSAFNVHVGRYMKIDPDTVEYIDKLTVKPSEAYIRSIDNLIKRLKAAGIWNKLDRMWIFATEIEQHASISLKNPGSTGASAINSPTWIANRGYEGASGKYIDLQFIPSSQGVNYTITNASYGHYLLQYGVPGGANGGWSTPGTYDANVFYVPNGNINYAINSSGGVTVGGATCGLHAVTRTSNTSVSAYNRGALLATSSYVSNGVPTVKMFAFARDADGGPSEYAIGEKQAMVFYGSADINQTVFNRIFDIFAIERGFYI